MTNQEIFDLIARFERSSIYSMRLTSGDFSLELEKSQAPAAVIQPTPALSQSAPAAAPDTEPAITAPLVGTFYAASAPDAEPFVRMGSRVKKGQTVCLIEAMKMISEVPAPCDCVITEVVKSNGTLAAFGETLLRYQPC